MFWFFVILLKVVFIFCMKEIMLVDWGDSCIWFLFIFLNFSNWFMSWSRCFVFCCMIWSCWVAWLLNWLDFSNCFIGLEIRVSGVWNLWDILVKKVSFNWLIFFIFWCLRFLSWRLFLNCLCISKVCWKLNSSNIEMRI